MKKTSLFLSVFLVLISFNLSAEGLKTFQLKDGSSIKGQLISFAQGVYVVKTLTMGEVQLKEVDVAAMVEDVAQAPAAAPQQNVQSAPASYSQQMQQVQQQMMSNPQLMQQVQNLAQDPEIIQILSDPQLIQEMTAAMNGGNPQSIQQNPKVQQLLQNSKMKDLIQQIQPSLGVQPQAQNPAAPATPTQ